MSNIDKGDNQHPFTPADMKLIVVEGTAGNALNQPEFIASSIAGVALTDRAFQLKKLIYSANGVLATQFAQLKGKSTSDYVFSVNAVAQVLEMFFSRGATLLSGNTVNVTVDGNALTQVFVTSHQATLDALAVKIAAEGTVATAVRIGDHLIQITSATAGTDVVLTAISVTGGVVQTVIESREKLHGQLIHTALTYS